MFRVQTSPISEPLLTGHPASGATASFVGTVRDLNEGRDVERLEYEAYEPLASTEGAKILAEAMDRFGLLGAACVHRVGMLEIGDVAIRAEAQARHRHEAFLACEYIVDEVKRRVPIWKKEHYIDGASDWINAGGAADAAAQEHDFYRRQMRLPSFGDEGQAKLRAARVLVVGAGGLGCPALVYLAAAGVGHITLVDSDRIEASNLHRQPLFVYVDRGRPKAEVAAERLRAQNPFVQVQAQVDRVTPVNVGVLFREADLVLDCTDNFATKFLLSDAAILYRKPVIQASLYQFEGQMFVIEPGGPCLRCLWPETPASDCVGSCAEVGVLGSVAGVLGAMQAHEALRRLLGHPEALKGELLTFDLTTFETHGLIVTRNPACPACGSSASVVLEENYEVEPTADLSFYTLVDIREPDESAVQPCLGARLLPLSTFGLSDLPEGEILLVCQVGIRSLDLAIRLRKQGIQRVHSLRGGVEAL